MRRFLYSVALLAALVATSSLAARAADLSESELKAGRKLYLAKCARCHKFYDPAKYSDAEWHKWMEKMSTKAKLKPEQMELLSRYLDNYRISSSTNAERKVIAPGK
jgi:cytochrome c5